ncbi:MAG TPA: hypothetical protein VNE82_03300 [Candidatus Binataceae bacterium]|nr:hypothetical protein [Candidatus Binataceae bacterium]
MQAIVCARPLLGILAVTEDHGLIAKKSSLRFHQTRDWPLPELIGQGLIEVVVVYIRSTA